MNTTTVKPAALASELHPDPVTQEPGFHPVGTAVGAAAGSVTGAVIGSAAGGPTGGIIGAAVGGVAGGLTGKAAAEAANPTAEDAYWQEEYANRPYFDEAVAYNKISPAYRVGYTGYWRLGGNGRSFEQAEEELRQEYERSGTPSDLTWEEVRPAARDAWRRMERRSGSVQNPEPASAASAGYENSDSR